MKTKNYVYDLEALAKLYESEFSRAKEILNKPDEKAHRFAENQVKLLQHRYRLNA